MHPAYSLDGGDHVIRMPSRRAKTPAVKACRLGSYADLFQFLYDLALAEGVSIDELVLNLTHG